MASLTHKLSIFSDGRIEAERRSGIFRIRWDDEIAEFHYRSRTASPKWNGLPGTPAVFRYYPAPREGSGDYRVNLASPYDWRLPIIRLMGDGKKFAYWTGRGRAQFNSQGWPLFMYVGMSGNLLHGELVGNWLRFQTLKQSDANRLDKVIDDTLIHKFSIVAWRNKNGVWTTTRTFNTPQGIVRYPLVTKEGMAYIPARYVIEV